MNIQQITAHKRKLIREIEDSVAPFLYESGYRTGPLGASRPLKLVVMPKPHKVKNTYNIEEVMGFSEEGALVDEWAGGLVTHSYSDLCIEDLMKVHRIAIKFSQEQTQEQELCA